MFHFIFHILTLMDQTRLWNKILKPTIFEVRRKILYIDIKTLYSFLSTQNIKEKSTFFFTRNSFSKMTKIKNYHFVASCQHMRLCVFILFTEILHKYATINCWKSFCENIVFFPTDFVSPFSYHLLNFLFKKKIKTICV